MDGDEAVSASTANTNARRKSVGENAKTGLLASGSALGAIAMSSCCILPLALFSLGVTGAWIGNLAALYPYKPYFFIATAGFLAAGFWKVYRKPKPEACAEGSYCASPVAYRINKAVLWAATLLVFAALIFPYVATQLLET